MEILVSMPMPIMMAMAILKNVILMNADTVLYMKQKIYVELAQYMEMDQL